MRGDVVPPDGRVKGDVPEIHRPRPRLEPGFLDSLANDANPHSLVHEARRLEKRPDTLREPHRPGVDDGERLVPAELSASRSEGCQPDIESGDLDAIRDEFDAAAWRRAFAIAGRRAQG